MKTVLFVDKGEGELWHSFLRYSFVLDEYQRQGYFAVCDWHSQGMTVATAAPALQGILGDEREWTAVIACDLRGSASDWEEDIHYDNPFDFALNYAKGHNDAVNVSAQTPPLVRLAQMLGGIPDKAEMVEQQTSVLEDYGYEDGQLSETTIVEHHLEYHRPEGYYQMLEDYRLGLPRPKQIICITPRYVNEDLQSARDSDLDDMVRVTVTGPKDHSNLTGIQDGSLLPSAKSFQRDFWERNDYPASARFVVCDRELPSATTGLKISEEDGGDDFVKELRDAREAIDRQQSAAWLRYWVSVLTLVFSQLSPDELKPYRLYGIDVGMNFDGIKYVFDRRYSEWQGARKQVLRQIESEEGLLKRTEFEFANIPNCETELTVDFDLVSEFDLMADDDEVTILRDVPTNDLGVWSRQRKRIGLALGALLRAPRRALRNVSRRFHEQSCLDPEVLEYCVLNRTECEELEDNLDAAEIKLAASTGRRAFRFEAYDNTLDQRSQAVRDAIDKRSQKNLMIIGAVTAIASVLMGLGSFILHVWLGGSEASDVQALVATLVSYMVVFIIVVLATMLYQWRLVRKGYKGFNDWMRGVLTTMHDEAERLGKRISTYATYRKRWSVVERQRHLDDLTTRARWLGEKDALLQSRLRDVEQILPVEVLPEVVDTMDKLTWSSITGLLDDQSFFNVYSHEIARAPFNASRLTDVTVQVPFEFITSVDLNPIQIW